MVFQIRIGVKFCGNCNPLIACKKLFQEIKKEILKADLYIEFSSWESPNIDLLLVISGCPVDCATRPDQKITEIVVAGETIDGYYCNKVTLPKEVSRKLLEYQNCLIVRGNKLF